jgi:hypothetical protein
MNPIIKKVLQAKGERVDDLPLPEASELCDEELNIVAGADDSAATSIPVNCCLGRRGYHDND